MPDVCRALALRLRESNSITVFKTLLIIHTMIRNGAVDNVLSHLAADQAGLKLRNVSQGGNWQGEKWLEQQLQDGDQEGTWKSRYGSSSDGKKLPMRAWSGDAQREASSWSSDPRLSLGRDPHAQDRWQY